MALLLLILLGCATTPTPPPSSVLYDCVQVCAPFKAVPDTIDGGWLCYCNSGLIAPSMIAPTPRSYQKDAALWKGEKGGGDRT